MSGVVGELARASDALARPTLRLLDGKWGAFRVAVLRSAFSRDQRSIQVDALHAQIDTFLDEMLAEGIDVPASESGRGLCKDWVKKQWLFRDNAPDGSLVYSLTSASLEALDLVQSLSRDRALVSESRLNMILETVRRWATEASADPQDRIDRLSAQISELEAERRRITAGGTVAAASDDRMLDGYANLMDLIGQLPSDFKRVEEAMLDMHRQILKDLRDEERMVGDVLDEYLEGQDRLLRTTPHGRAFDGAFELLRDADLMSELRENIQLLLDHPAAVALEARDIGEMRGTVAVIRQGTRDVLDQRHRLSKTLKEHIVTNDPLAERELERVLRGIQRELTTWMETAGPRSAVDVPLLPPIVKIGHLRDRMWDPASAAVPPPLAQADDDIPEPPSIEELRAAGGPSLEQMRDALIGALNDAGVATAGEVFNGLPIELRRPVEILGLLHTIASLDDPSIAAGGTEDYQAIRPDGQHRGFGVPTALLSSHHAERLAAAADEGTIDV
ncbi:hypothetical protein ABH935_005734 [Catenulispora sp. GAS73]|uniref:DUF3375 domain-containing protein n=1 Tax=Catenulispora sp. GAS73 TaxID=3156269 RepID=UPI00351810AA